jgi:hypothetical protein
MLGRRERHRRRARGGGWPVNIAIKPWAAVPAFFATGVLRQSAGPFHLQVEPGRSRIRHVATLEFRSGTVPGTFAQAWSPCSCPATTARAHRRDGHAVTCRATPIGEITIVGPGAGLELAGQGVLSDLIAVARSL